VKPDPRSEAVEIVCLTTLQNNIPFLPEWERLAEENIFLSPLWLKHVEWEYALRGARLYLAAEGGTLRGVLPLRRRDGGMLIGLGYPHGDYGGLLLARDDNEKMAETAALLVRQAFADTRLPRLRLSNLPAGFDSTRALLAGCKNAGLRLEEKNAGDSFVLPCGADFETVYSSLRDSKSRYNLRRAWKQLEKNGAVTFAEAEKDTEIRETLSALFSFHRARWGQESKYHRAEECSFAEAVALDLAREKKLALYALRLDGKIVAAQFGFRAGSRHYYYNVGYDESVAGFSPGSLLLRETLRCCCEEGMTVMDLLRGREQYKLDWNATPALLATVTLYNPFSVAGKILGWWKAHS